MKTDLLETLSLDLHQDPPWLPILSEDYRRAFAHTIRLLYRLNPERPFFRNPHLAVSLNFQRPLIEAEQVMPASE